MQSEPIYVTRPFLPPFEEYTTLLNQCWETGVLTHNGPLLQRFEKEFSEKIGVSQTVAVTNGTVALQMAIRALGLRGEIITTPFTWIATVSAIKWEGCTPVFCDIDPQTLNIDPEQIEQHITEKTVAILPVHVFGNPCDVEAIQKVADKHGLKVIYDAAHAVGSTYQGKSLLSYGDISATSFHATKIFNTGEGGACFSKDAKIVARLRRIRFFGHDENQEVVENGFNGKMTEIHAAIGLACLPYIERILMDRKYKYQKYLEALGKVKKLSFQKNNGEGCNLSYFPVVFDSEEDLKKIESKLNKKNIWPRRYFYPSLNTFRKIVDFIAVKQSEDISKRILCFPMYYSLRHEEITKICNIVGGYEN